MEKWRCGEPSCTAGGNANWCSHSGKLWRFLKKLKREIPYNPVIVLLGIVLLGIYSQNTKIQIQRGICIPVFIAALSTIAKIQEEPNCPLTYEWIKKMFHCVYMNSYTIYIYLSAIKRNKIFPFEMI